MEKNPYLVEFPLRGEWLAPQTPGVKVPSHGTDRLGARYAYDFLQVDWGRKGWPSYRAHWLRYLLFGVSLDECYCWGAEIHAPCDGIVVAAEDGYPERRRVHVLSDLAVAMRSAHSFDPAKDSLQSVAGNYAIIKCSEGVYAALVHFQTGSLRVSSGQKVKKGEVIGRVGHSGNSFSPHLHFQLMDSSDMLVAKGLPCAFESYEVFEGGVWREVRAGIPTDKERIRFQPIES